MNKILFIALVGLILGLQANHTVDAVQSAQTMLLIKRQAKDERGNLIDLNKEPVPEPVSSGGIVESHKSTSGNDLADSKPSSMQNVKPKLKRIILPPGLSDQEKEVYRNKVKVERQRERRKLMRSSTEDDPYAKYLLDNYNKAKKREVRKRTLRLQRVNDGKGTAAEIARIELKRKRDREYQVRRRISQEKKQTMTKIRKNSDSSNQNKKD